MIFRIFNKDLPLHSLLFVIGEGVLIYLVILTMGFLWYDLPGFSFLTRKMLAGALLITMVCQTSIYFNDLYRFAVTDSYVEVARSLIRAMGVACIALALIYHCIPSLVIGHGLVVAAIIVFIFLGFAWRHAYKLVLKKMMLNERILLVGSGEVCQKILDAINERRDCGYRITGLVYTNSTSARFNPRDVPVYEKSIGLSQLAKSLTAKTIILAVDQRRGSLPMQELFRCKMQGIKIVDSESFYEKLTGKILVEKTHPSWFIFSDGFRTSKQARFFKRLFDIVLASLGLICASPLVGIIALAIKIDSAGPVIFKQVRCGKNERTFELNKFRSMIHKAEENCGPVWSQADDWRVTRVGRILRKYRLDEIPQMWNVLKGDMSFVGPRPERPEFVENLKNIIPYYSERHNLKPGLTGWAQISFGYGASVEDALEKLAYDLFYVKNMSVLMDLMIVLGTIKVVLRKDSTRQSSFAQVRGGGEKTFERCESVAHSASVVTQEKYNHTMGKTI